MVVIAFAVRCFANAFPQNSSATTWQEPPTLQPERIVSPDAYILRVSEISDDKTIYAIRSYSIINFWSLGVSTWPELVVLVAALFLFRLLWRILRFKQETGEVYCRCCNYNLRQCTSEVCPECGLDLAGRNKQVGHPRWPRAAVVTVLMGILLTAWVAGRNHLPRSGSVSRWLTIAWEPGRNRIAAWPDWMKRLLTGRYGIIHIDATTGAILKAFPITDLVNGIPSSPTLNGSMCWTYNYKTGVLIGRDVVSGAIHATVQTDFAEDRPPEFRPNSSIPAVFSYDNKTCFTLMYTNDIRATDLTNGQSRVIGSGDPAELQTLWPVERADPLLFTMGLDLRTPPRLIRTSDGTARKLDFIQGINGGIAGQRYIWARAREKPEIRVWDIDSLDQVATISVPPAGPLTSAYGRDWLRSDPGDRYLFHTSGYQNTAIRVWDVRRGKWIRSLVIPGAAGATVYQMWYSPDLAKVYVLIETATVPNTSRSSHILVYDYSKLDSPASDH